MSVRTTEAPVRITRGPDLPAAVRFSDPESDARSIRPLKMVPQQAAVNGEPVHTHNHQLAQGENATAQTPATEHQEVSLSSDELFRHPDTIGLIIKTATDIIKDPNNRLSQRSEVVGEVLGDSISSEEESRTFYRRMRAQSKIPIDSQHEPSLMSIEAQVAQNERDSRRNRPDPAKAYRKGAVLIIEAEMDRRARIAIENSDEAREEDERERLADMPTPFPNATNKLRTPSPSSFR